MKSNQYRAALVNVQRSLDRVSDEISLDAVPSQSEKLSASIAGSAWTSPKATEYTDKLRELINAILTQWQNAKDNLSQDISVEPHSVDEDGADGWKANFLTSGIN